MATTKTKYTFDADATARTFAKWLEENAGDRDYGYPQFVDAYDVGHHGEVCVEYKCDTDFARGVATGMEYAARLATRGF